MPYSVQAFIITLSGQARNQVQPTKWTHSVPSIICLSAAIRLRASELLPGMSQKLPKTHRNTSHWSALSVVLEMAAAMPEIPRSQAHAMHGTVQCTVRHR